MQSNLERYAGLEFGVCVAFLGCLSLAGPHQQLPSEPLHNHVEDYGGVVAGFKSTRDFVRHIPFAHSVATTRHSTEGGGLLGVS